MTSTLPYTRWRTAALRCRMTNPTLLRFAPGEAGRAGKRSPPGPRSEPASVAAPGTEAGVPVLEPGVREVAAHCGMTMVPGRMPPALAVTMLETRCAGCVEPRPVLALPPIRMPWPILPRRVPAPSRRMMAETTGPRLRAKVALGLMVVHHSIAIAYDDAEAQGGLEGPVHRSVPVRRHRHRHDGQRPEGGREQKPRSHGSSPSECWQAWSRACSAPFEPRLSVLFMRHSVGAK